MFSTVCRLAKPGISLYDGPSEGADAGDEFEDILQELQDNEIDTVDVTPQDIRRQDKKCLELLTQVLVPSAQEEINMVREFNMYVQRSNIADSAKQIEPLTQLTDVLKPGTLETLLGQMVPQIAQQAEELLKIPVEERKNGLNGVFEQMSLPVFFNDDLKLPDEYKKLKAKLLLVPYSTTDDYIAFDDGKVAGLINKM